MNEREKFLRTEQRQLRKKIVAAGIDPDFVLNEHRNVSRILSEIDAIKEIVSKPANLVVFPSSNSDYEMVRRRVPVRDWVVVPRKKKSAA